jgi:intracellular sulfur oxidation DsrE/DsrF family protein
MTEKKLDDKTMNELTTEDFPKIKVVFAPGAFDSFEGSQEELDELMAQIQAMVIDGSLFEKSVALEDLDPEELSEIESFIPSGPRTLQ